ncbi:MAG: HAD family hydrolase [Sediminibacterium sp.]
MNLKKYLLIFFATIAIAGCESVSDKTASVEKQQTSNQAVDPLPSWNDGPAKKSIIDFVTKTTSEGSGDFVPVADRIACFDNDGTLWSELPLYFQVAFAFDRIKELAPQHPEWKTKQPFKAVLEDDMKTAMAGGEEALLQIAAATLSGMTTEEFEEIVKNWIETAKHPTSGKLYKEMVFQPMLELLDYLRANGYETFIVSGGGVDFMRAWAEKAYGIPSYQIVGSSGGYAYEVIDGKGVVRKLPDVHFVDDYEGKPVGIVRHIGKRPIFTAGNSDGDYPMLQYTSTGDGPRFGMIVHHTDSIREFAYDRQSALGHLEKALDDAGKYNWLVVDMKNDWKRIYPWE